jgi:hypothetical protein
VSWSSAIALRLASAGDAPELERLAQLDSRPLPAGPHLIAFRDGATAAALSLATGELIADPFQRTAEVCTLLRLHANGARVAPVPTPRAEAGPLRPVAAVS